MGLGPSVTLAVTVAVTLADFPTVTLARDFCPEIPQKAAAEGHEVEEVEDPWISLIQGNKWPSSHG